MSSFRTGSISRLEAGLGVYWFRSLAVMLTVLILFIFNT